MSELQIGLGFPLSSVKRPASPPFFEETTRIPDEKEEVRFYHHIKLATRLSHKFLPLVRVTLELVQIDVKPEISKPDSSPEVHQNSSTRDNAAHPYFDKVEDDSSSGRRRRDPQPFPIDLHAHQQHQADLSLARHSPNEEHSEHAQTTLCRQPTEGNCPTPSDSSSSEPSPPPLAPHRREPAKCLSQLSVLARRFLDVEAGVEGYASEDEEDGEDGYESEEEESLESSDESEEIEDVEDDT